MNLLKTVSIELELDINRSLLQRQTEAPAGAGRDALFQQRKDTLALVRESIRKLKDEVRRQSEMAERCDSNLLELRFATVALILGDNHLLFYLFYLLIN